MTDSVRVWDIPTRVFHWSLASLFLFMILSVKVFDNMMEWHMRAGYVMIGLVTFRILWGLVGSHYARFAEFVASPVAAVKSAIAIVSGQASHSLGHNPAGGWMVLVLLLGILVQGVTGLFISDEIFWDAPFYGVVSDDLTSLFGRTHHTLQGYLIAFVVLHIAAVLWHRFRYKDPLIGAMVHGRKPADHGAATEVVTPVVALFICLAISIGLVVWLWMKPI